MRKISGIGILGLVVALALLGIAAQAAEAPMMARCFMVGDMAVPANDSMGLGYAVFTLSADGTMCHYKVIVGNLSDITAAHIHLGKVGEEGPPVVNLFTGPTKTGAFGGVLCEGDFGADALMGPMAGKTMKDLGGALHDRMLYVNVHTVAHPEGEIRGQVMRMDAPKPAAAPATGGGAY